MLSPQLFGNGNDKNDEAVEHGQRAGGIAGALVGGAGLALAGAAGVVSAPVVIPAFAIAGIGGFTIGGLTNRFLGAEGRENGIKNGFIAGAITGGVVAGGAVYVEGVLAEAGIMSKVTPSGITRTPVYKVKGSTPGEDTVRVNHYTTKDGREAIRQSGVIKASNSKMTDATFGKGCYGTKMGPENSKNDILSNNFGKAKGYEGRADVVIPIDVPKSKVTEPPLVKRIIGRDVQVVGKAYPWQTAKDLPIEKKYGFDLYLIAEAVGRTMRGST